MICQLCNIEISGKGLGSHLQAKHNINGKQYYDMFMKQDGEGICPTCGKETPFLKVSKGYQKHCCIICASSDKEVLEKVINTRKERFGVENFFQNKEIHEKALINAQTDEANDKKRQTSQSHYGTDNPMQSEEVKEKLRQTNQKLYSVDYSLQSEEIREKRKSTMIDKFGVEHALQNKELKQKQENTCMERFGVYNAYASNEIRQQIEEENLKKYGKRNVSQVPEIREKAEHTMEERYGVKFALQSEEIKESIKVHNREKFGVDYPTQNQDFMQQIMETRTKNRENFAIAYDCIPTQQLLAIFGTGWHQSKLGKEIEFIYNGMSFVKKDDISKIEAYCSVSHKSNCETDILQTVKSVYNKKIIENSRSIIKPLELDIYLPDLKLAIEFNGTFWHSQEANKPKDYHLTKSLLCREQGIRLIHIYEFEDIDEQLELLKSLILGKDLYPTEDFNKNNLIETIPQAEIIYSDKYTIYGAGKLY